MSSGESEMEKMMANPVTAYRLISDMTSDIQEVTDLMVSQPDESERYLSPRSLSMFTYSLPLI